MTKSIGPEERIPRVPLGGPKFKHEPGLAKGIEGKQPSLPSIKISSVKTADSLTDSLERSSNLLDKLEQTAQIDPRTSPSVTNWTTEASESLLSIAYEKAKAGEHLGETQKILSVPEIALGPAYTYYARPFKKYVLSLTEMHEVLQGIANGIIDARLVLKVLETLGTGASLIYKRVVLMQLQRQITLEEQQQRRDFDAAKNKSLQQIRSWYKRQSQRLFEEEKTFGIKTFSYLPHGIEAIANLAGGLSKPAELGNLGIFGAAKIVAGSYSLHQAKKEKLTYEAWVKDFQEAMRKDTPTFASPGQKVDGVERATDALQALLNKRKEALLTRIENLIDADIPQESVSQSLLKKLQIENKKAYENYLSKPKRKRKFLKLYLEEKQTMSVMTRNALKSLAEKKLTNQKKFFEFRLNTSIFSLSLATFSFITTFTLKALALASAIALSAAAFASIGLGIFIIGTGVVAVGLFFLRHWRPNLFHEVIRGVQLRIALKTIPLSYYQFRLSLLRIKKIRKALKSTTIRATNNKEMEKEEKKVMAAQLKKIDQKIDTLETKVAHWAERIKPLQQRLINAGWADFQVSLHLLDSSNQSDLAQILAEGMFYDEAFLDKPTKNLLEKQLGIRLNPLLQRIQSDRAQSVSKAKEALKRFFSMDERALIKFIKQQKASFEFGYIPK